MCIDNAPHISALADITLGSSEIEQGILWCLDIHKESCEMQEGPQILFWLPLYIKKQLFTVLIFPMSWRVLP